MQKGLFGFHKNPTSFEFKIFKWVLFPLIALALLSTLFDVSEGRAKCESVCLEKGYYDFRYTPSGRYGAISESCHCLTEEESNIKNRIPKGTQVF